MSKAIAGAAMLVGAAVLAFVPGLNVLFTPWLLSTMLALAAGGISMEAGAIASALTSNRGQNITTRQAAGFRQVIYGQQRVGGTTIYQSTTGGQLNQYNMIIVLASHQIDGIVNLYLDGRQVFWAQDGAVRNIGCGSVVPGGGTPATCTATLSGGGIASISASGGTGYNNVIPTSYRVVLRGGGGSGAQASATNSGTGAAPVWAVTVTNPGTGYTSEPEIEIQGAYIFGGNGAADQQDPTQPGYGIGYGIGPDGTHYNFAGLVYARALYGDQLDGEYMTDVTANDPSWGVNYSVATATALVNPLSGFGVESISVTWGGAGYNPASPPAVTITSTGSGSGAAAHCVMDGDRVESIVVDNPGSDYYDGAIVSIALPPTAGTPWVGGCAYFYLKIEASSSMFPAPPEIRVTVTGKNQVYDPRTGKYGYTANAALIVADAITDPDFGLGDPTVNQAQLIAAANVSDESVLTSQGYETNWPMGIHFDTSTSPGDALQLMMPAFAGRLSRIAGEWFIWPAYWQGPSFSFDGSMLVDKPRWLPYRKSRDLFNCVNGTYIAPNYPYNVVGNLYDNNGWYYGTINDVWPLAWQPTDYPQYAQDTLHGYASNQWLAEDGGITLPRQVNHRGVNSIVQAQRIAKILLLRNRFQGTGNLVMALAAWQMQPTDVMEFTWAPLGWTDKMLEVSSFAFLASADDKAGEDSGDGPRAVRLYCRVGVNETDPSVHEWSLSDELTPYDVPANGLAQSPAILPAPTALSVSSSSGTAVVGADGVTIPRALLTWTPPADWRVTQIQLQLKLHSSGTWIDAGVVSSAVAGAYLAGVVSGQVYDFQVRSLRANGATSAWTQQLAQTMASVSSAIPAAHITGLSSVATTGSASDLAFGTVPTAQLPASLALLAAVAASGVTVTAGASAQVGAGASATISGNGGAGSVTLVTGTGALAAGTICTVNFPATLSEVPNGVCAFNGAGVAGLSWTPSTTQLVLAVATALAPSTTYVIEYSIG